MQLKKLLRLKRTPFYLFDLSELERRIQFLRNALPGHIKLCYAVKANTFILEGISKFVDRLEICSPGELQICRQLGLPAEKFVISGVYKEPELMGKLISEENGFGIYTAESRTQFEILHSAAVQAKKKIPLLLRLTSGNQFGLDKTEIENIIANYRNSDFLDIRGIQYFSGTQKSSIKRLKRELDMLDSFLQEIYETHGYKAKELEFGPGLPVSYFQKDSFDEKAFLQDFSDILSQMSFSGDINIELGRSIAASCGKYFTQVVDLKCNNSENFAIVDGGMHQITYYGQSMAMKHPYIRVLRQQEEPPAGLQDVPCDSLVSEDEGVGAWNICGALCTINDILVKKLPLKELNIGDVLVFENTGAYCMTEGISLFLSRDLPEIVLLDRSAVPITVREHMETYALNCPYSKGEN